MDTIKSRRHLTRDCYVISKVYDGRAISLAHCLRGRGALVGVDLDDDCFSQDRDSRFDRLRYWLAALSQTVDFFLCSTPSMQRVAGTYAPALPAHVLNATASSVDAEILSRAAATKLEHAREHRTIRVVCLAPGDDPNVAVGLSDLAGLSGDLVRLRTGGYDVFLHVLADARALSGDAPALLARLPLPFDVAEWSEEAEADLLRSSLVCFLPVNAQNASTSKSRDRAITALTAGCQVLSAGYPLYEALAPFAYRDPSSLSHDIAHGTPALRRETVPALLDLLRDVADPAKEGNGLIAFLASVVKRVHADAAELPLLHAIIHGQDVDLDAHKFAHRLGMLSVGSPLASADLGFDVRFGFTQEGGLDAYVSQKAIGLLNASLYPHLVHDPGNDHPDYERLEWSNAAPSSSMIPPSIVRSRSLLAVSLGYSQLMQLIAALLASFFPGVACYVSDEAGIPFKTTALLASAADRASRPGTM